MHYISCKLCGKDETKVILEQPKAKYFPRRIVRCLNCGLVYVNPQPAAEELHRVYQEDYPGGISRPTPEGVLTGELPYPQPPNVRISLRLALLKKLTKPGSLLDVGCGSGEFLYYAKAAGWEGIGIEPSSIIAGMACKKTGLQIYEGILGVLSEEREEAFDLIAYWDTLEHVPDPTAELRMAWQLLKPNGTLAISTPNIGCRRYRLQKEKWRGFAESQEHIFFFNAKTLSALLTKCGFKIKKVLTRKISPVLWRWLVYFGLGNVLEVYAQK